MGRDKASGVFLPREGKIGVRNRLAYKICSLPFLKMFPLPQYPVCLVAALAEPASAKSSSGLTNFYTAGHYSNRGIAWRSAFVPDSNCLHRILPLFMLSLPAVAM